MTDGITVIPTSVAVVSACVRARARARAFTGGIAKLHMRNQATLPLLDFFKKAIILLGHLYKSLHLKVEKKNYFS